MDVLTGLLDDYDHGGIVAELLRGRDDRAVHDAIPLRLLGALHRAALAGSAPSLARHFPSTGGSPGRTLVRDALAMIDEQQAEVRQALDEGVQTNEVGRAAALVGGFIEVARRTHLPLHTFEVGASAGLLSWWDRYHYDTSPGFGPVDAAVVFGRESWSEAPDLSHGAQVIAREACDIAPVDVRTEHGRHRLESFVWPDQLARLARLRSAMAVVAAQGFAVEQADAADWLKLHLQVHRPGRATVVFHSIVLQYLGRERSAAMRACIADAGERASDDAPLAWLRMEPAGPVADVQLTMWPGGATTLLGTSGYHGPPVHWGPSS